MVSPELMTLAIAVIVFMTVITGIPALIDYFEEENDD